MAILEPSGDPVIAKALLKVIIIFGGILLCGLIIIISSIIGIVRAKRRCHREDRSIGAVICASTATISTVCWLLYWMFNAVSQKSSPIDSMFLINSLICVLPIWWLITAVNSNRKPQRHKEHKEY